MSSIDSNGLDRVMLAITEAGEAPVRADYPPGDLALWIFILAELLVFAIFFASYAFTRMSHVELFNQYQATLNRDAALVNTLALLTSSYFVMRGVVAAREGANDICARWLLAALGMGGIFLLVKSAEYAHHLGAGVSLSSNTFYMFYLSLTFFHFLHVILGMVILAAVAWKARGGGYSREDHVGVESGASYWHMVDLVWLILFPLVYVMR
ncbi:MAG: cytochrome c oxidase subunit 3 family protein [Sedimenticolaceae bacterium]